MNEFLLTTLPGVNKDPILFDEQPVIAVDNQLEEGSSVRESIVEVSPGDMHIYIKMMDGRLFEMVVNPGDYITNLKTDIHHLFHCPPDRQRLVFAGRKLEDDRSLSDCNVRNGSTLYLVQRLRDVA